ncbi:hypothetical protein YPPY55_2747, partial [Yersinia pestis PY-55]
MAGRCQRQNRGNTALVIKKGGHYA